VKAQKAFSPALKTSSNPAFRSKYADLSACVEAVLDALNENGVFLTQRTIDCESGVKVETRFVHESGEEFSGGVTFVPVTKNDAHGYGSALTYARRYGLMAACGIAPEDDDGNAAVKGKGEYDFASALSRAEAADKVEGAREIFGEAKAMAERVIMAFLLWMKVGSAANSNPRTLISGADANLLAARGGVRRVSADRESRGGRRDEREGDCYDDGLHGISPVVECPGGRLEGLFVCWNYQTVVAFRLRHRQGDSLTHEWLRQAEIAIIFHAG